MDREKARRELGRKIKEIRVMRGLTQEELGEKASLNYKFIGELERGRVNVSLDSLVNLAKALEIQISDLFRKSKVPVLRVKEKSPLSKLSEQDILAIKKVIRLLNKVFSQA